MRKITIFALSLALAASLCACGCDNTAPATMPSVTTEPNTTELMPTETIVVPVPETNVPDTGVNEPIPDGTDMGRNRTNSPMGSMN